MGTFADLFSQLDADDRIKGKQFEHICKWFLTNDPVYKHELRRVWLWNEWTGRWGIDAGIDLVAEDRQGHLWAIQAKAYNPAYRVTKRDVNKFLAESGREVFTYRMLIATTNLIDRIGERTIQDQEKRITFFRLNDLQAAAVDWPRFPEDLGPPRPRKPARSRKHQREAITKVVKGFESADRGQLIMACGTGKTLTALFINEQLDVGRTLILLPSLSLLKQTLNVWRANCTAEFASLPVCSDDTVASTDDDVALMHTSDLGVPVTTDPDEIAAFLRRRSGPRVVFATYQSSPRIVEAFALGRVPAFDLVIADEAHRCAGPVSSDFATVLSAVEIKAKRRLFMTATPRYFTGRVLKAAEEAEFEYASMDDEAKFGKVFHRLGFGEAIQRKLLTDYQVAIVGVDDATYLEWATKRVLVTRDGAEVTDAGSLAGQIGLAKAMRKYDLHRVISFHSRVKRAREFAASMPDVLAWMPARQRPRGELWSRYASGEMPAGDRYVLLQQLRRLEDDERGLLANARCLTEGVDVPALDGVAFIDPRRSEVDIVQAVGRAIRKSDNKTIGTIVIPVFINTDADPEVALGSSVFKPVWDVIRALRAHDDELGAQLDELRREMGKLGGVPRLPDKIHVDIPVKVNADFACAFNVRLVEQTTASWESWFGLLQQYVKSQGHARVPSLCTIDGYPLGSWVAVQRYRRAKGALDVNRASRLQDLPGWTWDPFADDWEEGFSRVLEYIERHGHAVVPKSDSVDGYPLGPWVSQQRDKHAKGALDVNRERRLEDLPGWTWDRRADWWEEGFSRLLDYVERHGDADVPRSRKDGDYNLGDWVNKQRNLRSSGKLSAERTARLSAINGWTWDARESAWKEGFEHLVSYSRRTGHARPPAKHVEDGYPLGRWVSKQRAGYARGQIPNERADRLNQLPGWTWDARLIPSDDGFVALSKFVAREGHAAVPAGVEEAGFMLGRWVIEQRSRFRKGTLDPDFANKLAQLPGWTWNALDARWNEGFAYLEQFARREQHCRVPRAHIENGFSLGNWLNNQVARSYRTGQISADRRARLESLPGWSRRTLEDDRWESGFAHLEQYINQYGTSQVPQCHVESDGFRLGAWVTSQRQRHKRGTINPSQARRLEDLEGWAWDTKRSGWEHRFSYLQRYVTREGTARVPRSAVEDGFGLGIWVDNIRQRHRKGTLNKQFEQQLESLPGWTWRPPRGAAARSVSELKN